ncbi:MAG: HAD family phosphatase [Gammaproteobacteria bacterium]|nr:HAD family phosphatase [Gammaproteobacteria bacterium]
MKKIQAVLFDYGGVLAEEGFSNVLEALAHEQNLAVESMTHEGMLAVYDSGFVLGTGSEADFWALLRERTGLTGIDADHRDRMLHGFAIRPWMLELVAQLRRQGYITGILSDQTDWLDRLDARDHFYVYFDHVYNSYTMGKGKRDPSHFTDVAADLGLEPAAVLFIDDSKMNIANAESAGMQAIQYVDRETLMQELIATGIRLG